MEFVIKFIISITNSQTDEIIKFNKICSLTKHDYQDANQR